MLWSAWADLPLSLHQKRCDSIHVLLFISAPLLIPSSGTKIRDLNSEVFQMETFWDGLGSLFFFHITLSCVPALIQLQNGWVPDQKTNPAKN